MKLLIPTSTGGHLTEILQLKALFAQHEYLIVTEAAECNKEVLRELPHKFVFPNGANRDFVFWRNLFLNTFLAMYIILKFRPDAIVTTGSHTAVPFCYIGKLFGCKVVWILSFCRARSRALSADIVYPIADLFIVQWENMLKYYKRAVYGGPIF